MQSEIFPQEIEVPSSIPGSTRSPLSMPVPAAPRRAVPPRRKTPGSGKVESPSADVQHPSGVPDMDTQQDVLDERSSAVEADMKNGESQRRDQEGAKAAKDESGMPERDHMVMQD